MLHRSRVVRALLLVGFLLFASAPAWADEPTSFLRSLVPSPALSVGTSPANGDQNPYGVAIVPPGFPADGLIHSGDVLVSNFNNAANLQGTGRTIVAVTPNGQLGTFFTAPASLGHVGLTTALLVFPSGLVVVGNTPPPDGTTTTIENGSLIFLDEQAHVLLNLRDAKLLQGPWDMTAAMHDPDSPSLYVSDVLSGTVTRINVDVSRNGGRLNVRVDRLTQVASGFTHRSDPNALVVGPTGLLLDSDRDSLYVADTGGNRIQLVHGVRDTQTDQGAGETVVSGAPLKGPLALARSPFGTIVASNGDAAGAPNTASNINRVVEIEPDEHEFVTSRQLDTSGVAGAIFGITIPATGRSGLYYVNDNTTTLNFLPVAQH